MREYPRRRAIVAGVMALLAGIALAFAVAGGDDDEPPGTTRTQTAATTETVTEPARETGETVRRPPPARDFAAIQTAVTRLVESAELNDARGVCRSLGQPASGSGPEAARRCADAVGIDLFALPSSDELSFDRVELPSRRSARVVLGGGETVVLRRSDGSWIVTAFRA